MKDLAEIIHQGIFKRSSRANAPENDNPHWRLGFYAGQFAQSHKEDEEDGFHHPLWIATWQGYERGIARGEFTPEDWREWKQGWHSARMQIVCANLSHEP